MGKLKIDISFINEGSIKSIGSIPMSEVFYGKIGSIHSLWMRIWDAVVDLNDENKHTTTVSGQVYVSGYRPVTAVLTLTNLK